MEAELKETFGAEVELVAGTGGAFEVQVDGREVYSRINHKGRYPIPGEVAAIIAALPVQKA